MIEIRNITEYDAHVRELVERAKIDHPGYNRYEITENGDLFAFSLGAYPSIVRGYTEPFELA